MFKILESTKNDLVAFAAEGKITKGDYDKITPLLEKTIREYSKVKLYIQIDNIEGIEAKAFLEDVKTYLNNFNKLGKVAVVGENFWHKMWARLASPFISGEIKYFTHSEIADAQDWLAK